jgi:hypothetical protein
MTWTSNYGAQRALNFWLLYLCWRIIISHQRPPSTVYDILSPTNSTLWTTDSVLWCTKPLFFIRCRVFLTIWRLVIASARTLLHGFSCLFSWLVSYLVSSQSFRWLVGCLLACLVDRSGWIGLVWFGLVIGWLISWLVWCGRLVSY